jgi:NUMOD3 motif
VRSTICLFGKKHTSEAIAKIVAAAKGANNPRYGVEVAPEAQLDINSP